MYGKPTALPYESALLAQTGAESIGIDVLSALPNESTLLAKALAEGVGVDVRDGHA